MSAVEEIYDWETVVAEAAKAVLIAAGLAAFSISDAQDFQKVRPRVEVVYKHMGETSPKRLAVLSDGSKRTSCFRGELRLHAITDADEPGKLIHSQYRAVCRNVLATLESRVNGAALTKHRINFVTTGHEETGVRSADGYQQTTFPFTVDLAVQQDAWESILNT